MAIKFTDGDKNAPLASAECVECKFDELSALHKDGIGLRCLPMVVEPCDKATVSVKGSTVCGATLGDVALTTLLILR